MATDTAPKQTDAKPADPSKDTTSAKSTTPTPTKSAASTPAQATAKPKSKPKPKPRAKTAAKSRTRSTAASSRSRTASKSRSPKSRSPKSRSRKPAAAPTARTATATATPVAQANVLNGGQQFVAGVIEAQEKSVMALVDYQTRAAELSQIPGVTAVAQVQAKVLRSVTHTYASAARALLK